MAARRRRASRRDGRRGHPRHVDGEHQRAAPACAGQRVAARPAGPAAGPPSGGSSRTNVTGRAGRHLLADDHHLRRRRRPRPARARAASGRRARSRPCRRRPAARRCRRRGRPRRERAAIPRSLPARRGRVGRRGRLAVTLTRGRWSSRPPASTRTANRALLAELTPDDADLVVLPRGVRPRLRRGRLRRQPRTPSRWTGRSRPRSRGWPTSARTTVVAGMFETADDPARPFNTLVVRGARGGRLPQDPPLRLLRLPRVRPAHAPAPLEPRAWSRSAASRVGLMTCYDLRFPELARGAGRRRRRGAGRAGGLGGRRRARSTTGARWCGPARSRTRRTSSRSASPARATPATRWSSTRSATCSSRPATAPGSLTRHARPRGARRGPADQPLAGQPATVAFLAVSSHRPAPPRRPRQPSRWTRARAPRASPRAAAQELARPAPVAVGPLAGARLGPGRRWSRPWLGAGVGAAGCGRGRARRSVARSRSRRRTSGRWRPAPAAARSSSALLALASASRCLASTATSCAPAPR